MRICIHTSFLHHEYCLTSVLGGLGGMRGDITGVGNPLDASKDPSADLGNLSALFGASQIQIQIKIQIQIQIQIQMHIQMQMQIQLQMQICISHILSHNNLIYSYIINEYKLKDNIFFY